MKFILTCFFFSLLFSFQSRAQDYVNKLENNLQFIRLSGEPLSLKYGNVSAVKVIYDFHNDHVYFLDSKHFRYHFDFCGSVLRDHDELALFNEKNYRKNKYRNYIFATVNYYSSIQTYTVEFASSEEFSADDTLLYCKIRELFFAPEKLFLFPATNLQIGVVKQLHTGTIPIITADRIFGGLIYQPIVKNVAYGYLRKIDFEKLNDQPLTAKDILVTNGSPNELPLTSGVIITEFQPPLSHINILCANRRTPIMAYKEAWSDKHIAELKNSIVRLEIMQDTFYIEKTTLSEAEKFWKKHQPGKPRKLRMNSKQKVLFDVSMLRYSSVSYAGSKASNLGELSQVLLPGKVKLNIPPGAFAIPFSFYLEHVRQDHIDSMIRLVSNYDSLPEQEEVDLLLKQIRENILSAPLDTMLLRLVEERIRVNHSGNSYRFRSSTNAEDIEGFNGAGLYDSKTGVLGDSVKTIEKAIKKVWASLWNDRAFMERKYFRILNNSVAMGILVHPSFGTEAVNGVAITKNIYRSDQQGYVVNLQKNEVPIVNPPQGVMCEQILILDETIYDSKNLIVDYLSYSNLNDQKPLLSEAEYLQLKKALAAIKKHYYYDLPGLHSFQYDNFAMDVEFKFTADRKLFIKQARFYSK